MTRRFSTDRDLFTTASGDNRILVLRDEDGDGRAERRFVFATSRHGLLLPFGLAFHEGILHPIWADNSNSTGDNRNGTWNQFEIYTANIPFSSVFNGRTRRSRRIA